MSLKLTLVECKNVILFVWINQADEEMVNFLQKVFIDQRKCHEIVMLRTTSIVCQQIHLFWMYGAIAFSAAQKTNIEMNDVNN